MSEIRKRIRAFRKVFLDTAPIIYFVEKHPDYGAAVDAVFELIDDGRISAVVSPVTLAECLVHPVKYGLTDLYEGFQRIILNGRNTFFSSIDEHIAEEAARLRAVHGITLVDALQVATALTNGCDGFVTNDIRLKKVSDIEVIVIKELKALP